MEKLKPCPFCGSKAEIFTSDEVGYLGRDRYTVKCGACMCGTGHYADSVRATEAWNRRTENLDFQREGKMNNKPLTQQELQKMAGKPVYCPGIELYGIVKYETIGAWAGVPFLVGVWHRDGVAVNFEYNIAERKLKCYGINEN